MILIPPLSDLIPPIEPNDGEPLDVAKMMAAVRNGEPLLTSPERNSFAARPGRADCETALKAAYSRFQPAPAPATEQTIAKTIEAIVAARIKALSPSTLKVPEKQSTRTGEPVTPQGAEWSWDEEIEVIGDPEKIPTIAAEVKPMRYAAGGSAIDNDRTIVNELEKRATSETRKNGMVEWMRKEIASGESIESLAAFAEGNGQAASAELIRKLGKEL
jgi:hypothetical protein